MSVQTVDYDFPVRLQPLFLKNNEEPVPRLRAVVREDTHESIGIVSNRYNLITHRQALDIVEPFTRAFGSAETKQILEKNGARLISRHTYRDKKVTIPSVGDTVALRIDVVNSYDGSEPLKFDIGALVLRCLNGMTAVNESIGLRFKHTGGFNPDAVTFPDPEQIWDRFTKKADLWDRWTAIPNSDDYTDEVMKRLMAASVIGARYILDRQSDLRSAPTKWELYDKLTYTITHETPRVRETERTRRLKALDFTFTSTSPLS